MAKEKIQWHPAFVAALKLEFKNYLEDIEIIEEYNLTEKPLQIDVIIIKKKREVEIKKQIAEIFKTHNIIEYKSPDDYLSIDDYYKVKAYAYLYKSLTEKVDEISINEITITLTSVHYPKKMMKYIQQNTNIKISKKEKGIYYIEGEDIKIQLLVTKELDKEENNYLTLLIKDIEEEKQLERTIEEYTNNYKNPVYELFVEVVGNANLGKFMEVVKMLALKSRKEEEKRKIEENVSEIIKILNLDKKWKEEVIEKGKTSEFTKLVMSKKQEQERITENLNEIVRILDLNKEWTKEVKEEGIKEEKYQTARNMLKNNLSLDLIEKITGLTVEDIEKM